MNPSTTSTSHQRTAPGPWREAWGVFCRNRAAVIGLSILGLIVFGVIIGPYLYPVSPMDMAGAPMTSPGDPATPLGTDFLGRDVLAGILHGGLPTLAVGGGAALIATLIGCSVGALGGYFGGKTDSATARVTEFFQVLPALLFAMVVITLFSATTATVTLSIGVVIWTGVARLTRAEFLKIKQLEYVRAARAIGAGHLRIALKVILPNAMPPIVVAATLAIGSGILFEAGLGFLGLSDPNVVSWGLMIGQNRPHFMQAWWTVVFPGLCIFLTVLSICLVGDGLNDALNPKLRSR